MPGLRGDREPGPVVSIPVEPQDRVAAGLILVPKEQIGEEARDNIDPLFEERDAARLEPGRIATRRNLPIGHDCEGGVRSEVPSYRVQEVQLGGGKRRTCLIDRYQT